MLRIALAVLLGNLCLLAGCDQPTNTSQTPPATPLPNQTTPITPGAPVTTPMVAPPMPAPSTPGTPGASGGSSITLDAAYAGIERSATRLGELFDSIQDDASATAAAPQIAEAGRELAAGMKQFKTAMAALSLAGQDDQISKFMEQMQEKGRTPQDNLIDKLERVVNSPQYPLVRNEINGLLDGMLEASTSGGRRGLESAIQRKKLRR